MKAVNLTKEQVLKIIDLRRNKVHTRDIERDLNISKTIVSNIHRAYLGDNNCYNKLNPNNRSIIDSLRVSIKPQKYEIKILFGLITLKVNPIN